MTLSINDFISIGAVVAALQLIGTLWLKARLESSIKHEYDKKLEEFPDSLAKDLNARLANASTAKSVKEILVAIKEHLHGSATEINPHEIVHFTQ